MIERWKVLLEVEVESCGWDWIRKRQIQSKITIKLSKYRSKTRFLHLSSNNLLNKIII